MPESHRKQKNNRTLKGKQHLEVYKYLERNAEDGKINLRVGELATAATDFLGYEVAPSTITAKCEDLDITYLKNQRGGKRDPSNLHSKIIVLENDVDILKEQVRYLMKELTSPKEFAEACSHEVLSPTAVEMNV